MLRGAMESAQKSAEDCSSQAKNMDAKFEAWLKYATELHQVCVSQESTNDEQLAATKIKMLVAQNLFDSDKSTVKEQKETANMFKKQLKTASDAYTKASDNFPSG